MFKHGLTIAAACLLAGASTATFAAPDGKGGSPGGMSSSHMSGSGLTNTNGPEAADRDKGQARASDRRSAAAASHGKAHQAHGNDKRHRPQGR